MKIASINVGRPREIAWKDRIVSTAIFKAPVTGPVTVRPTNLAGDGQADLTVHGGEDKAVYVYAAGHYPYWREQLPGLDLAWGAFGENLTLDDFTEDSIRIGDEFVARDARFIVTQPRMPCYKLGLRLGRDDMIERFLASGRSGFYLRVAAEGTIEAGQSFERIATHAACITVADAVALHSGRITDAGLLSRAIETPALPSGWRERFRRVLAAADPADPRVARRGRDAAGRAIAGSAESA
jgi:MOSC domain-containing protein YiiM